MTQPITPAPPTWPWFYPPLVCWLIADLISKTWFFRHGDTAACRNFYDDSDWIYPSVNTGVAWSMFDSMPGMVAILTLILIPILVAVYIRWYRHCGRLAALAFGSILGGALGNAYDRIAPMLSDSHAGGVRDFISVDLNLVGINYIWPTFNIADVAISVGFIALLLIRTPDEKTQSDAGDDALNSVDP